MKKILSLLLLFSAFSAGTQTLVSSLPLCREMFQGTESFPEALLPENFTSPLTQTVLREHYTANHLRWFDKMEMGDFTRGLFHLTEFSENPSALTEETRTFLENAAGKIPEIMESVKEASPEEAPHFQEIALSVLATFSKHIPEALKEGPGADWGRMSHILKTIADFDGEKPRWSLHKIKRAIKGRYALGEYIKCRIL